MTTRALVLAAVLAAPASAAAADLRVHDAPPASAPHDLAMRADDDAPPAGSAAAPDTPDAPEATTPDAPAPDAPPAPHADDRRFAAFPTGIDDLSRKVVFRFQIGYQLDEGQLADHQLASGAPVPADNRNTRFAQSGDLVLGSRGLLLAPLSSYLAAGFRLDQDGALASSTSVPSYLDVTGEGRAFLVRHGWAELLGLGGWLSPLSVRAGRQYRYGLAVIQFDGVSVAWEGTTISASGFVGQRVSLYGKDLAPSLGNLPNPPAVGSGTVAGLELELRLYRFTHAPVVIDVDTLTWQDQANVQASIRYELSKDARLSSYVQNHDGVVARWGAALEARTSKVTTYSLALDDRRAVDWAYDLVVQDRQSPAADANYLFFGPPTGLLRVTGRAGTVLLDNFDVLGTVAAALPSGDAPNVHQPAYLELGGAVDGRFAYNLQLAVLGRWRRYQREKAPTVLDVGSADAFADVAATGEKSKLDGGVRARYSLGRKQFAGELEVFASYLTYVRFAPSGNQLYVEDAHDGALGVRLRFEAWIGTRLRLMAEYEVNSANPEQPELYGEQRLRAIAEASF